MVEVLLRTLPLPRVCKFLGITFTRSATSEPTSSHKLKPEVQRVILGVDQMYRRFPLPDTCLRRSLVAGRLLLDDRPELVLGVRVEPHFEAHAWLTVHGAIVDWSNRHGEFKRLQ